MKEVPNRVGINPFREAVSAELNGPAQSPILRRYSSKRGSFLRGSRKESEYLKHFFHDTVNFDPTALRMAIDFAGVDQILAGSDYLHLIGSLEKMREIIRGLELAPEDEAKIFGGNAKTILGESVRFSV